MTEKVFVSRIEVGLMEASDSEKHFAEKPMKNFGEPNSEEKGFVCFTEGEVRKEGLSDIGK